MLLHGGSRSHTQSFMERFWRNVLEGLSFSSNFSVQLRFFSVALRVPCVLNQL